VLELLQILNQCGKRNGQAGAVPGRGEKRAAVSVNSNLPSDVDLPPRPTRLGVAGWSALEVALIVLVFFLYAGGPPPDVNEAHYLAKARHFWDRAWCAGDLFLQSADAHPAFYLVTGWLTRLSSLAAAAWITRLATWTLLGLAWQRLSAALVPRRWYSVLSAALFVVLADRCHISGEWVVGGAEAKGLAYVLVLLGLEALVRGRWGRAWVWFGGAAAMHVVVGGWAVVAAGVAWTLQPSAARPRGAAMWPGLVLGGLVSLVGLLPVLRMSWGVDPEIIRQANQIYVFYRLPHHLVAHAFPGPMLAAHLALFAGWWGLGRLVPTTPEARRLRGFVWGAVGLALAGAVIDQALLGQPDLAARLLRFYWFRLSDALLPAGAALACVALLDHYRVQRPAAASWVLLGAVACCTLSLLVTVQQRWADFRPGADVQSLPRDAARPQKTAQVYEDWRGICRWIAHNTPDDAVFLTPSRQQTFKWYAGRAEVVNFKDVPQDPASVVQWHERWRDGAALDRAADGPPPLPRAWFQLAERYDFQYVVVDRTIHPWEIVCPLIYANDTYALYFLPRHRKSSGEAPP